VQYQDSMIESDGDHSSMVEVMVDDMIL